MLFKHAPFKTFRPWKHLRKSVLQKYSAVDFAIRANPGPAVSEKQFQPCTDLPVGISLYGVWLDKLDLSKQGISSSCLKAKQGKFMCIAHFNNKAIQSTLHKTLKALSEKETYYKLTFKYTVKIASY